MLDSLLPVALRLLLVYGSDLLRILLRLIEIDVAGVPDEILEELVGVLLLDHETRGLDDIPGIIYQTLAVGRKLPGVDRGVLENVVEGAIDLLVRGHAGLGERFEDAVETELAVDVGSLSLLVDRFGDGTLDDRRSARQVQHQQQRTTYRRRMF